MWVLVIQQTLLISEQNISKKIKIRRRKKVKNVILAVDPAGHRIPSHPRSRVSLTVHVLAWIDGVVCHGWTSGH
jgi:hypothetical protein